MNQQQIQHELTIPESLNGIRLDIALATLLPQYSRSMLQQWIKSNSVQINSSIAIQQRTIVNTNQIITINATINKQIDWQAQKFNLNIAFENEDLIVINKPANLVMHPGAGNHNNTLANALLDYDPNLNQLPRAGLIHRLDKHTSGLCVIARNLNSFTQLTRAMQNRDISRHYTAFVYGNPISGSCIDANIGRHPNKRIIMAVTPNGKPARTYFEIKQKFNLITQINLRLDTGRTHQIRVHMNHIGYPIIGDQQYGKRYYAWPKIDANIATQLNNFPRQALHAFMLTIPCPKTCQPITVCAKLPNDLQELLQICQTCLATPQTT